LTIRLELPPVTDDLEEVKTHLAAFGCARIGGALSPDELTMVRERLLEQAAAERRLGLGAPPNQWVWNLINKGEVFRQIIMKDLTRQMMTHLLGENCLLSSFTAHVIEQGNELQPLHKDGGVAPDATPYPIVANMMWMITDFTEENGATRVVPGSHLEPGRPRQGDRPETIAATGPAGSAFVFDGRLWHGTGANRTSEARVGCLSYHCRGWVRQQENFALSLAPDVKARCPEDLLRVLGFGMYGGLGGVRAGKPFPRGGLVDRPTAFVTELR